METMSCGGGVRRWRRRRFGYRRIRVLLRRER